MRISNTYLLGGVGAISLLIGCVFLYIERPLPSRQQAAIPEKLNLSEKIIVPQDATIPHAKSQFSDTPQQGITSTDSNPSGGKLPPRLSAMVEQLRASGVKAQIEWARIIVLSWSDFGKAVKEIQSSYPQADVNFRIVQLIGLKHEESLTGLDADLKFVSSSSQQTSAAAMIGAQWCKRDPVAFAQYVSSHLTGGSKNSALAEVLRSFGESNQFQQASQILEIMPYSGMRSNALQELASKWAAENSAAALGWAQRLSLQEDRRAAIGTILGSAKISMETLTELANGTTDPEVRHTAVAALGDELLGTDLNAAMQWVKELPKEYQAKQQAKIATKLAQSDLDAGTKYLITIQDINSRIRASDVIAHDLVAKDPKTATRWLAGLPPDLQERAAYTIVHDWYEVDSMQASIGLTSSRRGRLEIAPCSRCHHA